MIKRNKRTTQWEVYLDNGSNNPVVGVFSSKYYAEEHIKFRYNLCKSLMLSPDLEYTIRKIKS